GSGTAFVKFAAARPGTGSATRLERVLGGCEALAAERGAGRLVAGVNTARRSAYRLLLASGFRAYLHGVAMQRPDERGFNQPDAFVLDDWR
ncbi:MAG: GNAT family N-acetyltransferase, partial [Burkholderiales bacterium]